MNKSLGIHRGSLAEAVIRRLTDRIDSGVYAPGDKLPSQEELGLEFEVSRTVVREAVASLRLSGRLTSRQGAGVFVADQDVKKLDFGVTSKDDIRSAMQILELRLGVEIEQVGLAAERRTSSSMAAIMNAYDRFNQLDGENADDVADADFAFHMAIAQATNNPQFAQFMNALGKDIFVDLRLKHLNSPDQSPVAHISKIAKEHGAILSAISMGDGTAARTAIRKHLEESLTRYHRLLDSGHT
jgi:GntR family transcriptional repressor for pyruvate dehydrogenase complex